MLQAWSIPLLQSTEGRIWRYEAMDGNIDHIPDELGVKLFSRIGQVLKDTDAQADDTKEDIQVYSRILCPGRLQ